MADVSIQFTGIPPAGGGNNLQNNGGNNGSNSSSVPPTPPTPPMPPSGGSGNNGSNNSSNNGGNSNPPTPLSGSQLPGLPTYERLAADVRRELQQRGAVFIPGSSSFSRLMNDIQHAQQEKAKNAIDDYSQSRWSEIQDKRQAEIDALKAEIDQKRQNAYLVNPNKQQVDDAYDREFDRRLKRINAKYDPMIDSLDSEMATARTQVEQDLVRAIRDLTDEEKKRTNDKLDGGYLGQLRQQMAEARYRRDTATDEKGVQDASKDLAEIQKRMARAMGVRNPLQQMSAGWGIAMGVGNVGMNAYNAWLANTGMEIGILRQAANGDAFGAMISDFQRRRAAYGAWGAGIGGTLGGIAGGLLAGFGSFGIGTGAGIGGGAVLGGGAGSWVGNSVFSLLHGQEENQVKLGQLWSDQEKRINQFTQIALIGRGNNGINDTRNDLIKTDFVSSGGLWLEDLGYSRADFAQQAAQRIKQRGFMENLYEGYWNAMDADALEKVYNMTSGSLGQLSAYDRYDARGGHKNDANQDMANLVVSLGRMRTLGMSGGQVLRANEFMSYQTQLMEMQKSWMDPNSNYAQRQLLSLQSAFGNNLDSRAISEVSQMQNAITNPQEGYSKAILYDVIQDLFPETKGNLLEIRKKQYSNNPEDRARIEQAMYKRLTQVYGGMDTTSGYLALSQFTGIQDPDRLRAQVNRVKSGLPQVTEGSIGTDVKPLKEYTPEVQKEMIQYQNQVTAAISVHLEELQGISLQMLNTFKGQLDDIITNLKK